MIGYEQAWAVCRTDPEAAARMLCEFARELDQLKAEVATLKAGNAALRRDCQSLCDKVQARDHPDGILAFMRNSSVPFDNNLSERDLRMMKLRHLPQL